MPSDSAGPRLPRALVASPVLPQSSFPGQGLALALALAWGRGSSSGRPIAQAPSSLFLPQHGSRRVRWGSVAEPQVPPGFSSLS